MARKGRHMPKGRGWRLVRTAGRSKKSFAAVLIKWVRMNDAAAIVMLKVRSKKAHRAK